MQDELPIMIEEYHNELELWGGIECTINRVQDNFFDQLDYSGHYHRASDIDLLANTGIKKIRYPILWEKHQPQKNIAIDWSYTIKRLDQLKQNNIEIIVGLVHHGSGPAFTHLLDPDFPYLLANYAKQVAQQFPDIIYYTPINEPLTTARFSGLYGFWYPHKKDDDSFARMLINEIKGIVLSMQAIRKINPNAKLVQTEDLGKTYSTKLLKYQADFENHRRWLTYDLLCGKVNSKHPLWKYFISHQIQPEELEFFCENKCVPDVLGFNYYLTSERFLDENIDHYPQHTHGGNSNHQYADVEAVRIELKENSGIEILLQEAWERYGMPISITEVHLNCHREDQLRWFKQVWNSCHRLKAKGVDLKAVTAWAMFGSYGWNKLLTEPNGDYEPGVFDVRNDIPRPTALARFITSREKISVLHQLSYGKGWWERNNRFFYTPGLPKNTLSSMTEYNAPILILGKNGTLGKAFAKICQQRFLNYKLVSRQECNICDDASIDQILNAFKPWAIINAAGFVRVDEAEEDAVRCYNENTSGPEALAKAAKKYGIKLVSFSSDLVFDGEKKTAYVETDKINPLNVYGQTKAEAERLILIADPSSLIIRTSAFFGPWDQYNFVHHVQRSLVQNEIITVANDITISPTYVPDLANITIDLLIDDEKGIWHLTNNGELTWADLANEVADRFKLNRKYINAVSKNELNYTAKRPSYSPLTSNRGILLPSLDNALKRYTNESRLLQEQRVNEFRA